MDSICAIIDAQGFYCKNEFFPRELAIAPVHGETQSWESNPPMKYLELSPQDQKVNDFIMKYTGLPYDCFTEHFPIDKMKFLIAMIYNKYFTEDKPNFGIKNYQFGGYLATMGLPYVEIKCPSIYTLGKIYGYQTCERHILKDDGMCAIAKVNILKNWVLDHKKYK